MRHNLRIGLNKFLKNVIIIILLLLLLLLLLPQFKEDEYRPMASTQHPTNMALRCPRHFEKRQLGVLFQVSNYTTPFITAPTEVQILLGVHPVRPG